MKNINHQKKYWINSKIVKSYIKDNSKFDNKLSISAWKLILKKTKNLKSILECGSNIGRNVEILKKINKNFKISIIQISPIAYKIIINKFSLDKKFNGLITENNFEKNSFDLVFTMGVLIHIKPDHLLDNMKKIFSMSKKYILIGEYFNKTPVSIKYRNKQDLLFKNDFGKIFLENFKVKLLDYGFLWGKIYDTAGFDDVTWWLFEKKKTKY